MRRTRAPGEAAREGPVPVLYLITDLHIGGAERALARTALGLDRTRFAPQVTCLFGAGPVADELRAGGIPVHDLGMRGRADLRVLPRLARLLRRERPAILHAYLFHANLLSRLVGRACGVPIILCAERTMEMEGRWRVGLNRLTARWADRLVANSDAVRTFVLRQICPDAGRVCTIMTGVDPAAFQPPADPGEARRALGLPPDGFIAGTVSRLDPVKGIDDLLRAGRLLRDRGLAATLLILGYGPEAATLRRLAAELGLEGAVRFPDPQTPPRAVLACLDIFVLASRFEGLPNVALEAMAMGVPVVATAVGGTAEAVADGLTGTLVPPNRPDRLAEAIVRFLKDPAAARAAGAAGRRRVLERFSAARMVADTEALYEQLLHQKLGVTPAKAKGWRPI